MSGGHTDWLPIRKVFPVGNNILLYSSQVAGTAHTRNPYSPILVREAIPESVQQNTSCSYIQSWQRCLQPTKN